MFKLLKQIKQNLDTSIELQTKLNKNITDLLNKTDTKITSCITSTDSLSSCYAQIQNNTYSKEETRSEILRAIEYNNEYKAAEKTNYVLLRTIEEECHDISDTKKLELFNEIESFKMYCKYDKDESIERLFYKGLIKIYLLHK